MLRRKDVNVLCLCVLDNFLCAASLLPRAAAARRGLDAVLSGLSIRNSSKGNLCAERPH